MRILLLTQVLPYPPDSGPKVKTWNLLKYLSARQAVTLVSFVRGDQRREVEHLRGLCEAVHTLPMQRGALRDGLALVRSLLNRQPWVIVRDRREDMLHLVRELTRGGGFDAVHADQLNMAQYAQAAAVPLRVVDTHNALWLLYKRIAETTRGPLKLVWQRDWRLLRRYEGEICRTFDAVTAVSDEDSAALKEVAGGQVEITVMPIAVDTGEVQPVQRAAEADRIIHIGTMFWPPNVDGILWFAREIFPLIAAQRPQTGFDVIGARPPAPVSALPESEPRIRVTGYVDDPLPYLQQAGVMVVPLLAGGGMRVKILNALAQGLPIVTTSIGCEGIAVEDGVHVLVADTPQDFAQAVLRLLADRELADRLSTNGRRLAEQTYDFHVAYRALDRIYPI